MKFFIGLLISLISSVLFSQNKEKAIVPLPIHSVSSFMENKGQWDEDILFKSSFKGGNLWVQKNKLLFHLQDFQRLRKNHVNFGKPDLTAVDRQHVVHLNFKNSNEVKRISTQHPSTEYYNFFLGNNEKRWAKEVHTYTDAILYDLYNDIDLHLIQEDEQLKYEFLVAPQVDPSLIQLDIAGANSISLDKQGRLHISTPIGEIIENKPYVYQEINGQKKQIRCDFSIQNNLVTFDLGNYDKTKVLVIDPVLIFATYSGSVTDNFGMTATYGHDGTAYSGGTIFGNSYPTPDKGVFNIKTNFTVISGGSPSDVFISKYSADGSKMLWTAFLGGATNNNGAETIHSLICDKENNIYGFGATSSKDFPTTNGCFQNTHGGGSKFNAVYNGAMFGDDGVDIYTVKISSNGHNLLGSTYIGGSENDGINANSTGLAANYFGTQYYDSLTSNYGDQFRGEIMLDKSNNILIASSTRSTNFPIKNAAQSTINGQQDGVLLKLKNDFSQLLFSTYIGGKDNDAIYSVKIDSSNNIVFCGGTSSHDLKTSLTSYQKTFGGGKCDGFIGKISPNGASILHLTYVGLNNFDQTFLLEINSSNEIFVIGHSLGGNFPITNASYFNSTSTQFIAKFDSTLSTLLNATRYGNGNPNVTNISPAAFLVDDCGNIYVSGWGANILQETPLSGMPVSNGSTPPNGFDFHLFVIDKTFSNLVFGSYIGGNQAQEHVDGGTSRFDKKGIVYQSVCGGCGRNSDFPVTQNAWSKTNNSDNCNNLVFKYDFELVPTAKLTASADTSCLPIIVNYTNSSKNIDGFIWDFGNGTKDSTTLNLTKTYTKKGNYNVKLLVKNTICNLTDTTSFTTIVFDTIHYDRLKEMEFCKPTLHTFQAKSYGTANQYSWSANKNFIPTLKTGSDSTLTFQADSSNWVYYQLSNQVCPKIDSVYISVISPSLKIFGDTVLCSQPLDSLYGTLKSEKQLFTFNWIPTKNIQSYPSANSVIVKMDTTQYIYLQVTGNLGCVIQDSLKVRYDTIRYVKVQDIEFCTPTLTTLQANSYGTANEYSWSTHKNFIPLLKKSPDSTFSFNADSSQWIYYKLTNGACPKIDSSFISVISSTLKITGDTQICPQKTDSLFSTIQSKYQVFTFDWSPKQIIQSYPSSNSIIVKIDTTQNIYLQATGNLGCIIKDSIKVNLKSWDLLNVLASANNTTILKGAKVKLFGKPDGYNYLWTPEDKVLTQTQQTEATIWENTLFNLKVSDGECTVNDTILIKVIPWECDFPFVFVPNAFSPNNDGENDVLYVRGHPIKSIEFRVFNRWGEKVFESHDINQGWDGTFKGKLVDPDVFDYYLDVECVGEEHKLLQGNVTVLR